MDLDKQYSKVIAKGARRGKFYYKIQHRDKLYAKRPNHVPPQINAYQNIVKNYSASPKTQHFFDEDK
jgi:hypothetical protein